MILFHGTIEENIKKIKKHGLMDNTEDQWLFEVLQKNVCCVSHQPSSGEGGNAAYFAYRNPKIKSQNGYLVVIEMPEPIYQEKIITIFDNKTLDDYVRFHFFVREEFREVGYELYLKLQNYQQNENLNQLDTKITKREGHEQDSFLVSPQDQRLYNKNLKDGERYIYNILDIEVTDDFFDFIQFVGQWEPFYKFLELHFANIEQQQYQNFVKNTSKKLDTYWSQFYHTFPITIPEPKYQHLENWFSPNWLKERQLTKETNNCQILMEAIAPEYIMGFIKITTPSGFAGAFRSCREHGGFSNLVWKEVNKLWDGTDC